MGIIIKNVLENQNYGVMKSHPDVWVIVNLNTKKFKRISTQVFMSDYEFVSIDTNVPM